MNPAQLNSKSWLGALAGAVKAFCMLFVRAVNVADDAVAMADKSISAARERQVIDITIEMSNYAQRAQNQAVLAQVKSEESMVEFVGNDPERAARVEIARKNLDSLISRELAALRAKEQE